MSAPIDLVSRMISAIEAGDLDGVRACYSPDIVVWANFDGKDRDLEASLRLLGWLLTSTSERRYEVRRREEIDGGVLQQHVLHGTVAATGKSFAMPACLVVTIDGDRISRIDEYLDRAAMTPAFAE
ncbi:MAG: nuclear transport factor 2 family protein [Acidimicrobiia bacterium]|nr:nuclear transport factor 2 family protein [Acidimicrobiia bacterium]